MRKRTDPRSQFSDPNEDWLRVTAGRKVSLEAFCLIGQKRLPALVGFAPKKIHRISKSES